MSDHHHSDVRDSPSPSARSVSAPSSAFSAPADGPACDRVTDNRARRTGAIQVILPPSQAWHLSATTAPTSLVHRPAGRTTRQHSEPARPTMAPICPHDWPSLLAPRTASSSMQAGSHRRLQEDWLDLGRPLPAVSRYAVTAAVHPKPIAVCVSSLATLHSISPAAAVQSRRRRRAPSGPGVRRRAPAASMASATPPGRGSGELFFAAC